MDLMLFHPMIKNLIFPRVATIPILAKFQSEAYSMDTLAMSTTATVM